MKKFTLSALALSQLALSTALAQDVGVASAVRNDVSLERAAEVNSVQVGSDIQMRDLIKSGDNSALQMLLLDETTFTVGPKAEIVVDKFVYDPDAGTGEMAATVARGAFRMMSGKTARNPENVSVDTPVASMGIRGTIVEGAVGLDAVERLAGLDRQFQGVQRGPNATLIVLRGPSSTNGGNLTREGAVEVRTPQEVVTLTRTNTAVFIPAEGAPMIGPFPLPPETVKDFGELMVSIPDSDPVFPVPGVDRPDTGKIIEDEPFREETRSPEGESIVDRPTLDCPVTDGIPVTGPGLLLGGDPNQTFDDFGTPDFGLACLEQ